jgi:hypothetical protein
MENPKFKIESDGHHTEVTFDGKILENAISVIFSASQNGSTVAYADVMVLEDGKPKTNEKNEILIVGNKLL